MCGCCEQGGVGEDVGRCEASRGERKRLIRIDAFVSATASGRAETNESPAAAGRFVKGS